MKHYLKRLRWLFRKDRQRADLDRELAFHLDEEADEQRDLGLSPDVARRAARLDLGNQIVVAEDTRAAWGWLWLERLGQDVRYALRIVRRRPGFSIAAVVTLTLGIGGNTAVFSLIEALLLRTVPVARPGEIVRLIEPAPDGSAPYDVFTQVTQTRLQQSTQLAGVVASPVASRVETEITERGEGQRVFLQLVSDNYFDVLGVVAARGTVFHPLSSGTAGEPVAVISDDYWQRHFARDPAALGSHFRLRDRDFTIAGVAPPGFRGLELDVPSDMWVSYDQMVPPNSPNRMRGRGTRVTARLQPGVTPARAAAEATAILGRAVGFEPGATGYSKLRAQLSRPLLLVAIVVGLVLLIACANLANLMLAATSSRERELGVRTAIGASRSRIVRQLITESLVLAMAGGALGVALAYGISAALLGILPADQAMALPNLRFDLNLKVLAFAIALSCLTCLMFGLLPALRATRGQVTPDLRSHTGGSRERAWLSRGLLVSQVVMCTALLTLAGVFLHTLQNLRGQDSGYREDHLLVADVEPPRAVPEEDRDRLIEAFRARVAAMPGVEAAAFSHVGQLSGSAIEFRIGFPDRPVPEADQPTMIEQRMSPGFLRTMGTWFLAGRDFVETDDEHGALVAIVNDAFVRRFLPDRDPLGARFFRSGGTYSNEPMTIVGVVKDSKWVNLRDDSPPMYYRPYRQMGGSPVVRLVVRTTGAPRDLAGQLLPAARAIDPRIVLTNIMPFRDVVNRTLVVERLTAEVSTACGLLALVIAAVGLYGVLAYSVVRRRREIGVRIAIGAAPATVEWMFLRESLTWLGIGLALGLPLAFVATRGVSSMLFALSPRDPVSIIGAVATLALATVAAAYVPARRASRVDPVRALRED